MLDILNEKSTQTLIPISPPFENMSFILHKVKSLPALIKKQKSAQKVKKLCDSTRLTYEEPPARPRNWLFLERCRLMMELVDYLIALHGQDEDSNKEQKKVWYWANDVNKEYPMTYQLDADSMVSDSLLHDLGLDPSSTVPLTVD